MSDHIEAAGQAVFEVAKRYPKAPEWAGQSSGWGATVREVGEAAWAAGVEALIAHEPCSGTGRRDCGHKGNLATMAFMGCEDGTHECPGPHTVIVKGDGTKLHAEKDAALREWCSTHDVPYPPNGPWTACHLWDRPGDCVLTHRVVEPLPSEWRIEWATPYSHAPTRDPMQGG